MGTPKTSRTVLPGLCCLLLVACSPPEPTGPAESVEPPGSATATQAPADAPARETVGDDPASTREVLAESLPYAEIGEELVYGHFAIPVNMIDPLPAVLLIHDWYGLDENVRTLAERLAGDGYIVLAVDLFLGRTADTVATARELEIEVAENPQLAQDNLRQAADFIRVSSGAPALAVMGFGFGGGWALDTTLQMPDRVNATVSYYGQVGDDTERLRAADAPFLGFFVESDSSVPPQSVRDFEELMRSLSKDVDIRIHANGRRGFAMPGSDSYQGDLAEEAWARVLAFLDAQLASGE